ncbi:MAG: hypothetical protein JXA20_19440 [Spirochaetes bacterium]|nr:hypothetical protein [Spirochaetota bacterium]
MRGIAAAIAAALCLQGGSVTYVNARFGFAFNYPRAVFTEIREGDCGDGIALSADSPFFLCRVYGSYNVFKEGLSTMRRRILVAMEGAVITRECRHENWLVITGRHRGMVFYRKRLLRGDTVYSVDATYDAKTPRYGRVVDGIVQSLNICGYDL